MNILKDPFPPYAKVAFFAVAVISVSYILQQGSAIIVPILFSTLLAILLNPIVNFLNRKRVPRPISIGIVITIAMALVAGLVFFLVTQISLFSNMLPALKAQLIAISQQTIQWISTQFNIPINKLEEWFNKTLNDGIVDATSIIGQTIVGVSSTVLVIFLIPVYIFMILYYKPLIMDFISKLFTKEKHHNIEVILFDTKSMIQRYLVGLLIESIIVSGLNVIGLSIIGVKFAILLGVIGGILNIIPYIGGVVAVILPMTIALATQSVHASLWVLVAYIIVQFIDNNMIMPYIVASKVKINALASIIVVLIGSAIWGVSGMFLSIPLTAIVKVIFDRIESMKPYGFLLGDSMPNKRNYFSKKQPYL